MKRFFIPVIISLLIGACSLIPAGSNPSSTKVYEVQSTAKPTESTVVSEVPVVTFKRSGGLAGKTEEWSFYLDGRIVSSTGTTQAVPGDVSRLVSDLKAQGIYDLKDSYGGLNSCNDCFTYTISIATDGKSKTITTSDGVTDRPEQLVNILTLINTFISTAPTQ